jgi:hypothetical protein
VCLILPRIGARDGLRPADEHPEGLIGEPLPEGHADSKVMTRPSTPATERSREVGRTLVIRIVVIAMTLSLVTIVTFMIAEGGTRLPQQLVRLTLTAVLCIYLLRGAPWARWTSAALFLVGGLLSLGGGLALLSTPSSAWVMVGFGAIYLYCGAVLMASRSVGAFFSRARQPNAVVR